MKRLAEKYLKIWLTSKRRKPLILRGARQTGKSTLVRLFAECENLDLLEINLERHLFLNDIFKTQDIDVILKELQGIAGKSITPNTLLFLDEIQATPIGISSLRYFYEDLPELPVIAAGSLLEFTLSDHNFSMPVGRVDYRHLGPMTFKEYISEIYPELLSNFAELSLNKGFSEYVHKKLTEKLKEYFFIGGLPEAILAYKETQSMEEVFSVHRSICGTYLDDFSKYAKQKELVLLQKVFKNIPTRVGQKVIYSKYSNENSSKEIKNCIELLVKAKIAHAIHKSDCSGLPLGATVSNSVYKLIFMDVGLLNHVCGINLQTINSSDNFNLINKGQIAEQFAGQHLAFSYDMKKLPELNYWLREGKQSNAEVDFVIALNNSIIPIEVKAGKSGSLKSLHQFAYHKKTPLCIRFDLNNLSLQSVSCGLRVFNKNKKVDFNLLSLPIYAIEELERILKMRNNLAK